MSLYSNLKELCLCPSVSGREGKIREIIRKSVLFCGVVGFVIGYACLLLGRFTLIPFVPDDPSAVSYGMVRFKYLMTVFFVTTINNVVSNSLAAFGYSALNMINSVVTVFGLRMLWMAFIYPLSPTFETLFQCYTISWILSFLANVIVFLIVYPRKLKRLGVGG